MGNVAAVKSVDLAAQVSGTKTSSSRQTDSIDEGSFQKLLNTKAEEDTGTRQADDAKGSDKKEVTKDQEKPEKPEAEEQPEETAVPEGTALEQAQAALLFQITPEKIPAAEEVPEEVQLVTELGAAVPEEVAAEVLAPAAEQLSAGAEQIMQELPEVTKEITETGVKPEEAVLPKEEAEEQPDTKAKTTAEKPKETGKAAQKEEKQPEVRNEQPIQSVHPETHQAERTPAAKEVPTEHVRVQEPEEIPEKVLDQLIVKTSAGIKEFEIQLEPYDLGKIIIKAAFGKDSASISIVCNEQRTMELLAKNARDLGAIMEENLGTPTTIVVEEKETGYLEQQNQNNEGNNGQNQEDGSRKQNEKNKEKEGMDFLQQLRLGLV